jgi:ABC-2 type transport system permease protein
MFAVWKREMQSYFFSPVAYVFIAAFMAVCGYFFAFNNVASYSAAFNSTMGNIAFVFMFIIPILTMRLISEDRRTKTDQLLLTAPVSMSKMIIGKYLAAVSVFTIALLISLIYPLSMAIFGDPAWGEIFTSYIGCFLLGAALIALGMFLSSLTDSQAIAAVSTMVVIMLLYVANMITPYLNIGWLTTIIGWFSIYSRYDPFYMGQLDLPAIVYFISFSAVFVFLTARTVEKRRWSEG